MLSASAGLVAGALLTWPDRRAPARLRRVTALPTDRRRPWRPGTVALGLGCTAAGWLLLGPGGALAVAALGWTCRHRWQARTRLRDRLSAVEGLAESLRAFTDGLRSGAHPADAAELAATEAHPAAERAMRAIASAARLDGDVRTALAGRDLDRLGTAWQLAQRHGLPLADVIESARRDLDQRVRFARQVQARMAGPRASATVLAVLPLVGIALGQAMGAAPVLVLGHGAGQLLLVVGAGLLCAGIAWSARLTEQSVLR